MLSQEQWRTLFASFMLEAHDLLAEAEAALLGIERDGDAEAIHALFRAVHTLKGSSGLFGLDEFVAFAHRLETRIMQARDGDAPLDSGDVGHLLRALDVLRVEVERLGAGEPAAAIASEHADLLDALACPAPATAVAARPAPPLHRETDATPRARWHVSLRFAPELMQTGVDPARLVGFLSELGEIRYLQLIADTLPAWDVFDPEQCHFGIELGLDTDADRRRLAEVFEFVEDTVHARILAPDATLEDYRALLASDGGEPGQLGEILVAAGLVTRRELEAGLARQSEGGGIPRIGEMLVADGIVPPAAVEAALEKQTSARERRQAETGHLRVSAAKLDELIALVGELVTAAAASEMQARRRADGEWIGHAEAVGRHVEQIREVAMRLRMVEIGETFNRFQRLVRDVCSEHDKAIDLLVEGADTELDKTIVERIVDPLTHLVRNALDHGIEPRAERRAAGKPETGRMTLRARHEAGSILIEVEDDGRGLSTERIRAKAVERGLIAADAALADTEVQRLIFEPGFSTADTVSRLSGRGVGMDVVKQALDALRGEITIDSRPGEGCRFRLRLPLTLAIIDGFLIEVAGAPMVLPLDLVSECFEMPAGTRDAHLAMCELRGRPLPLIGLRQHFDLDGGTDQRRRSVVVVNAPGRQIGLVVDHLLGEQQIVVKPLGPLFEHLGDVSGASVLGTGGVALILDVARIAERVHGTLRAAA